MKFIALAAGGFFAGAKIRDIRWWFALSKEWPTTSELLDWPKIEGLLAGNPDGPKAGTILDHPN